MIVVGQSNVLFVLLLATQERVVSVWLQSEASCGKCGDLVICGFVCVYTFDGDRSDLQ